MKVKVLLGTIMMVIFSLNADDVFRLNNNYMTTKEKQRHLRSEELSNLIKSGKVEVYRYVKENSKAANKNTKKAKDSGKFNVLGIILYILIFIGYVLYISFRIELARRMYVSYGKYLSKNI